MNLWHLQFGHLIVDDLKLLTQRNLVDGLYLEVEAKLPFCQGYVSRKQHKELFPKEGATRANEILGLVHNDIWRLEKTPFLKEQGISSCSLMVHFRCHFVTSWKLEENAFPSSWSLRLLCKTKLGRSCRLYKMIMEGSMCKVNFKNT